MVVWHQSTVNPPLTELDEYIDNIERSGAGELHPVVKRHLRRPLDQVLVPFPRCEEHHGRYLYGLIHLPTSADDGLTDFMELTFIATLDEVWTVLRHEGERTPGVDHFQAEIAMAGADAHDFDSCGKLLGRFLTVTIGELEGFLGETGEHVEDTVVSLTEITGRHLSRLLKEKVPVIRQRAGMLRQEIESITNIVDQLVMVLDDIIQDRVDLREPTSQGFNRELFDKHTEIHLSDTLYRARRLQGVMADQLRQLEFVTDTIKDLRDEDEVTSGRFMAAVASIMLFPTFIAGLYGMNFDFMPELRWQLGYISVIVLIFGISIAQIWYFRRRRWI